MAIPEEIRKVQRPVNTVVVTNGTNTAKRYAVRERKGVKYIPGGNPQPIYGKIIGHIINNEYVPLSAAKSQQDTCEYPATLSWGGAAFLKTVSEDIVSDLLDVFDPSRVYTIISMCQRFPSLSQKLLTKISFYRLFLFQESLFFLTSKML
jgi:hypothetical protein